MKDKKMTLRHSFCAAMLMASAGCALNVFADEYGVIEEVYSEHSDANYQRDQHERNKQASRERLNRDREAMQQDFNQRMRELDREGQVIDQRSNHQGADVGNSQRIADDANRQRDALNRKRDALNRERDRQNQAFDRASQQLDLQYQRN